MLFFLQNRLNNNQPIERRVKMPRTIPLTAEGKITDVKKQLANNCRQLMFENEIEYKQIAGLLGITPQALSYQFRRGGLKLETVLAVVYLTGSSDVIASTMAKVRQ